MIKIIMEPWSLGYLLKSISPFEAFDVLRRISDAMILTEMYYYKWNLKQDR